eukprot:TRINITY_DN42202_c0_g1_i1.p1 TRINITY_DN42202_c0_g1~~TRINITY_DN42202_c0_g1_i1.p1  ORF type:complete len:368 (-),score=44.48 TRINITY_DN42202_c0_g1_i1:236-1339(-)
MTFVQGSAMNADTSTLPSCVQECWDQFLLYISFANAQMVYEDAAAWEDGTTMRCQLVDGGLQATVGHRLRAFYTQSDELPVSRLQKSVRVLSVSSGPCVQNILVLAFRGSTNLEECLTNVSAELNDAAFKNFGLLVHSGWHSATIRHWDIQDGVGVDFVGMLIHHIEEELKECPHLQLLFCGHSLGGACAQVACLVMHTLARSGSLSRNLQPLVNSMMCITFGAPMPFALEEHVTASQSIAREQTLQFMAKHCWNYVHNNDPVPRIPSFIDFVDPLLNRALRKTFMEARQGLASLRRFSPMCETRFLHISGSKTWVTEVQPCDKEKIKEMMAHLNPHSTYALKLAARGDRMRYCCCTFFSKRHVRRN